jgi:hypothetical protein
MIKAAEQLGFTAKGVKGDQNAFFSEFPLPAIAHVIVDGTLLHYVVIHKITPKQVIIADPAKGIVKMAPEEFFKEWTGVLILLVPAQTFKKGKETKSIFERFWGLLLPQKRLVAFRRSPNTSSKPEYVSRTLPTQEMTSTTAPLISLPSKSSSPAPLYTSIASSSLAMSPLSCQRAVIRAVAFVHKHEYVAATILDFDVLHSVEFIDYRRDNIGLSSI